MSVHYEDVWRVRGLQRIEVPAGSFEAIAFERETLNLGSSSGRFRRLVRFWLEAETGAPLLLEYIPLGGHVDADVRSWEAMLFRPPGGSLTR